MAVMFDEDSLQSLPPTECDDSRASTVASIDDLCDTQSLRGLKSKLPSDFSFLTTEPPAKVARISTTKEAAYDDDKLSTDEEEQAQFDLESAILRRCAAGSDQLDKQRKFAGVNYSKVKPGDTGLKDFPRPWVRWEGSRQMARGTAEWFVPKGADTKRRMLFLHGGTYVHFAPQDAVYQNLCSRLAIACDVCVLSVDYRMAEEHRFPSAYDDSLAALSWLVTHGPESPTAQSKATDVFVCGDSAGGGLAMAVCLGAKLSLRKYLRGCIPLSGWLDMTASTPSYDTRQWDAKTCYGDAVNAGTTRKSGQGEAESYLGHGGVEKHGRDWRVSPFFASAAKLRKLPPTLFQVGDFELIRDESVLLHQRMVKNGHKDATCSVYPRMWHCWHEYSEGGGEHQRLTKAVTAVQEIGSWVQAHKSLD